MFGTRIRIRRDVAFQRLMIAQFMEEKYKIIQITFAETISDKSNLPYLPSTLCIGKNGVVVDSEICLCRYVCHLTLSNLLAFFCSLFKNLIEFFVLQYNAAFLNNLGSNFLNNIVSISPIFCYGKVIIRTGLRFHFAQLFTEIKIKLFH